MCRWKAQQCSGDTDTAIISLRERLDDLTEIEDPYKDNRDVHPLHEVSFYTGLIISFDVVEPYYPERVLRQFGRVQTIPTMPMIQAASVTRGKTSQAYKLIYSVNRWQQDNWRNHLLNEKLRSVLAKFPWECDPKYMEWFMKITHPYIQPSEQRTTARRMRGTQEVIQSKLVKIDHL
ncbi:hypothetical protein LguiA_033584 [Lonicera macranthoides]